MPPRTGHWHRTSGRCAPQNATTICHSIRISADSTERELRVVSHATCSPKILQNRESCRAHGTAAATTPCFSQQTRGAGVSIIHYRHQYLKCANGVSYALHNSIFPFNDRGGTDTLPPLLAYRNDHITGFGIQKDVLHNDVFGAD